MSLTGDRLNPRVREHVMEADRTALQEFLAGDPSKPATYEPQLSEILDDARSQTALTPLGELKYPILNGGGSVREEWLISSTFPGVILKVITTQDGGISSVNAKFTRYAPDFLDQQSKNAYQDIIRQSRETSGPMSMSEVSATVGQLREALRLKLVRFDTERRELPKL